MAMSKELPEPVIAVRALLMKLYHSRQLGEAFYHAALVNGEAPPLEAQGWIERHGDGWRLTDKGLHGWALMNAKSLISKTWYKSEFYNELREQLKRGQSDA